MGTELARQVADAILFEGYVLYPYRASAQKNQARWQFGVLAPPGCDEPVGSQTECLIETGTEVRIVLRFLQVQTRDGEQPWDEGVPREVPVRIALGPADSEMVHRFEFAGGREVEDDGLVRQRWPLRGSVTVMSTPLEGPYGLTKLRVRVANETAAAAEALHRPLLLRHSLVAAHSLLSVTGGSFVSMLEPPEWAARAVAGCVNEHTWPVLVGADNIMLSSPIILYDYPEIAPESAGDMCDATEMDEMLVLRTLTLTPAEKAEARATDGLAAGIIDQVDAMPAEMLERLHGAIRYLRKVREPAPAVPWWDPGADQTVSPESDTIPVTGGDAARGSQVRLHPRSRGTDAQDMFLVNRRATVQAVLSDVDGASYLAVTLDDDPAADLQSWYGRYLYFLPTEVELVTPPANRAPTSRPPVEQPLAELRAEPL